MSKDYTAFSDEELHNILETGRRYERLQAFTELMKRDGLSVSDSAQYATILESIASMELVEVKLAATKLQAETLKEKASLDLETIKDKGYRDMVKTGKILEALKPLRSTSVSSGFSF